MPYPIINNTLVSKTRNFETTFATYGAKSWPRVSEVQSELVKLISVKLQIPLRIPFLFLIWALHFMS